MSTTDGQTHNVAACQRCGQPWTSHPHTTGGSWSEMPTDCPVDEGRAFIADVLHDCLSSFQHVAGNSLTFDRDGAVDYLLSPSSGLTIALDETGSEHA